MGGQYRTRPRGRIPTGVGAGLQNRNGVAFGGFGGFDSHTLPPVGHRERPPLLSTPHDSDSFPSVVTTLLLVNPVAGHGRARHLAAAAQDALAGAFGEVRVVESPAPGAAVQIVQDSVGQGVERVMVLGGDGTVHEAANGLLRGPRANRPPLGVIPAGTGNDFAKLCGTARLSPGGAVQCLARGSVRHLDVGQGWGEFFLNSIGIGFDAEVADRLTRLKHGRGLPAYLVTTLRTLASRATFEVRVEADTHSFEDCLLLLEIGNGPVVGGGFRITPGAQPDDGLLDICAIQDMPLPLLLLRLPLVMLGRHLHLPQVRHFRTSRLRVVSPSGALRAQFDGEIRTSHEPLDVQVVPSALPVLCAS